MKRILPVDLLRSAILAGILLGREPKRAEVPRQGRQVHGQIGDDGKVVDRHAAADPVAAPPAIPAGLVGDDHVVKAVAGPRAVAAGREDVDVVEATPPSLSPEKLAAHGGASIFGFESRQAVCWYEGSPGIEEEGKSGSHLGPACNVAALKYLHIPHGGYRPLLGLP